MSGIGRHWASLLLLIVLALGAGLYFTGRLQLRWQPVAHDGEKGHDHAKEGEHAEEESRVSGDKAVLDTEAIKAAGIQAAPAQAGSVAVSVQAVGEIRVPDERLAQVTSRVAGIVREIHRARGDQVEAGAPLLTLESPDLGDARAAHATATTELQVAEANVQLWRRRRDAGFAATPDPTPGGWVELDQAMAESQAALTDQTVAGRAHARMKELQERGLRSRTELITAEADLSRASSRVAAASRRLAVLGTVAETEATKARQKAEAARARLRALGAEPSGAATTAGSSSRFVVRSPISGVVTDRQVTVGESVEPTTKVFAVADLSEVWVVGALYDKDVGTIFPGMAAVVRVQGLGDLAVRGHVVQIGPQVDEKTRTLPVRVAVRNQPSPRDRGGWALRPGMFASIDLEASRKAAAVLVPTAAVQTLGGQDVVFVETALSEGAAFQRRPVKLGTRDDKTVEVIDGLAAGEKVVVANAYLLKSEFERSKISHGHAH